METNRITSDYGPYTIVVRKVGDVWEGRSFHHKKPVTRTLSARTNDDAVMAVRHALEQEIAMKQAARENDGIPLAQEYRAAFERINISDGQRAMLHAHLAAPDHTLTATQLSAAAGSVGHEYANLHYGLLARALGEELHFTPKDPEGDGSVAWTFVIAVKAGLNDGSPNQTSNEWRWKLRSAVAEALREFL